MSISKVICIIYLLVYKHHHHLLILYNNRKTIYLSIHILYLQNARVGSMFMSWRNIYKKYDWRLANFVRKHLTRFTDLTFAEQKINLELSKI